MIAVSICPERKQIAPDEPGEEMGGTGCTDSHDDDMLITLDTAGPGGMASQPGNIRSCWCICLMNCTNVSSIQADSSSTINQRNISALWSDSLSILQSLSKSWPN